MKNVGVRVVSAALAACMLTSILPVSAFAAAGVEPDAEPGIAVQEGNGAVELPSGGGGHDITNDTITADGTYIISQDRNAHVTIDTDYDVTIDITNNIDYTNTSDRAMLIVKKVKTLIIRGNGHTITSNKTFLETRPTGNGGGKIGSIVVDGGTYKCQSGTAFNFQNDTENSVIELDKVTAEGNGLVVFNGGAGTVKIKGGTYTGNSASDAAIENTSGSMEINATVSAVKTAVGNRAGGTVTINGGTYTSQNNLTVNNAETTSTMNIHGGTIKCGNGTAVLNSGTMTIDEDNGNTLIEGTNAGKGVVINSGTLDFNKGTIDGNNGGTGLQTVVGSGTAKTTINDGTIRNCGNGISMQKSGTTAVTLKKAALSNNGTDIVLSYEQQITIDDNFINEDSGNSHATIRVFDPKDHRQLTTSKSNNNNALDLVSNNGGWEVHYNETDQYYELLKVTEEFELSYEDADAVKVTGYDENDMEQTENVSSGEKLPKGTDVTLTPKAKAGQHCVGWEVTSPDADLNAKLAEVGLTDAALQTSVLKFKMPACNVHFKPVYKNNADPADPAGGDTGNGGNSDGGAGGALAAVVVGGAAAWGIYEAGTGIYRMMNMRGIPLPTTRAELALLIWQRAEKPEPESTVLFEDIDEDDTDLQKAARWMVEQELMDEKDDNKFKPYGHVTKLRVCTTWNEAKEKGLIE